jgi:hypothetical protein
MRNARLVSRTGLILASLGLGFLTLQLREARADRIVLRGGGQIRGKVLADPKQPDRVIVLGEKGKTPLRFQKAQVIEVIREPSALDDYLVKRNQAAATAEGQHELGLWCEQHKLTDLATVHFEAALKQNPQFAPAHQKLGHVLYGDRWLSGDELREAQGLVRYKGHWITQEEKAQREEQAATTAEQVSWMKKIKRLHDLILVGDDSRRRDAEAKLREIHEPVAVNPLVRVLGESTEAIRSLLDHILGAIPGPEASAALVSRILAETDPDIRTGTFTELEQRKEPNVIPLLVKALTSTHPEVVNRAAWTLANLNAVATVPKLIPALITTQYTVVWAPSNGGSSGGGFSAGFGSVSTIPGTEGMPVAYNGSSVGVLTGPTVAPGAVGYGVASVPLYGQAYTGAGINTGGSNIGGRSGMLPRMIATNYRNVEVLAALVKMTGADFGYDIPTWRRWLTTSFRADPSPVRRVPQP